MSHPFEVKVRAHCAICDCDLFLLTMDWIGVSDVFEVLQYEHFHWILYNKLVVIRIIAVAVTQCEWAANLRQKPRKDWVWSENPGVVSFTDPP